MQSLSFKKALELTDLAEKKNAEYRQRRPAGGIIESTDLKELLFEPESAEAAEFKKAVISLSRDEAVDAVALMYVGRGDYLDGDHSAEAVRKAFDLHHDSFAQQSHEQLTSVLMSKTAVIHDYLRFGADRLKNAF
ncbi:DUF3775 domain-containing protein [Pseudomonas helleri]|uniref:DUF3775 domain-containing protein n=1 Tax=Pseudomonas helleri TaxID=1608996 RepID=UPI003FD33D59